MFNKRIRNQDAAEPLNTAIPLITVSYSSSSSQSGESLYECTSCNKRFSSFQALGGHRASHARPSTQKETKSTQKALPKLTAGEDAKPMRSHKCSVCGQGFSVGQALGGHMKRHRVTAFQEMQAADYNDNNSGELQAMNGHRVLGLDLNLTPFENDVAYALQKLAPMISL